MDNNNDNDHCLNSDSDNDNNNNIEIPQIIELVSRFLSEDTSNRLLNEYRNKDEQHTFYQSINQLIINSNSIDSELNKESLEEIFWELLHNLVESLNTTNNDWSPLKPTIISPDTTFILNTLEWLSNNCSAREYLLVLEELQGSSFMELTLFTKIQLVNLSRNALKRIATEKRFNFLKTLLPNIIKILIDPTLGPETEESLQKQKSEQDLQWEYPLNCIMEFINTFIIDLKTQESSNISNEKDKDREESTKDPISLQQHLFLRFIIQVLSLETISNPPQPLTCNGIPLMTIIGENLSLLGASIEYIFSTDARFRQKNREIELEDIPTEQYRLPSPLSPYTILKDQLPYIISLLQQPSYKIGLKAIQIISFLQKRIKSGSISIGENLLKNPLINQDLNNEELILQKMLQQQQNSQSPQQQNEKWLNDENPTILDKQYHFLQLVQFLFMSNLSIPTRFNLLANLIKTCVFPSFTGLLVHIFKEQIDQSWGSTDDEAHQYFVSPKIIEILSIPLQVGGNLLERMDAIMNGLNTYRFLLIRDRDYNHTGIWSKSKIMGSRDAFLNPLKKALEDLQSQFNDSANGNEEAMKKALEGVSKMGMQDKLTKDDVQRASTLVVHHLSICLDVIDRIFELQNTLKEDD
eukprot:gene5553-6915_t